MSHDRTYSARRWFLRAGVVVSSAALAGLMSRKAAARSSGNFPYGYTNEEGLSAHDENLPQRARDLIRIGVFGIAKEDPTAMEKFFHPTFRFHGPGETEWNREQLWEYFAACRAAFDDLTVTRLAIVSDGGNYLASRTRFAGVFARPFTALPEGPIQPNGKPFDHNVVNIFRYALNGQLAEEWVQYDTHAFISQLRIDKGDRLK